MRHRLLTVGAAVLASVAIPLAAAAATPPEPVSITLTETFTATGVVGDFVASGGVFDSTSGTMASVSFKPVGVAPRSRDHLMVYTATDQYTTADGSFSVSFEGSCAIVGFDESTHVVTLACGGNWRVNGGTGDYARLKGTGTFDETQYINVDDGTGYGTLTETGRMHID